MKRHYYRLAGDSLFALDKLIQYDSMRNSLSMDSNPFQDEFLKILGREPSPEDIQKKAEAITRAHMLLAMEFTAAQLEAYQDKLGFTAPRVVVRNYLDGQLYRAYHVMPKIAMNPGTSKKSFGLTNMVHGRDVSVSPPQARVAIFTAYEDYKGNHFAPPGAVKLTDDEFYAYEDQKDDFEYYRTYDEGVEIPADFNPAIHQTVMGAAPDLFKFSHAFLLQGDTQKALLDYDREHNDFIDKYQKFRSYIEKSINAPCLVGVDEAKNDNDTRAVQLTMSRRHWEHHRQEIENVFLLKSVHDEPFGDVKLDLVPRLDTQEGRLVQNLLDWVPVEPRHKVDFGFPLDERGTFDDGLPGFPYMKMERYGDARVLAFRMPPHVKQIDAPQDCVRMDADEYKALSGKEEDLPTHAFLIDGKALDEVRTYDAETAHWRTMDSACREKIEEMLRGVYPGGTLDKFELCTYERGGEPRFIEMIMPYEMYHAAHDLIMECFTSRCSYNVGKANDRIFTSVIAREDTEKGREISASIKAVPYPAYFPLQLGKSLGLYANDGYALMRMETLTGLEQKALLHYFPSYITGVDAPAGTVPLSKIEYALILAESFDIRAGSIPPPRPPRFAHLPMPEGYDAFKRSMNMKASKDKDGLPLHERTEFSWFERPFPR